MALADFDSQIACLMLLFPNVADSVKSCSYPSERNCFSLSKGLVPLSDWEGLQQNEMKSR